MQEFESGNFFLKNKQKVQQDKGLPTQPAHNKNQKTTA
jgi:hypothetical protein